MGIGPDLSAIRNAKIQEKKLRKTTKRVYTSLVKKEESLQELSNQKDQDELQTIRRTEMRSLLNELGNLFFYVIFKKKTCIDAFYTLSSGARIG
jgi:uracil phosphoribosyltransferase